MTILFVAAVVEELGELAGMALGVGPVAAAARAAAVVTVRRPSRVVMIGTAGRYAGGPPIGAVVAAGRCGWADGASVAGLAYVPRPPTAIELDPVPVRSASVLTVAGVTTDPDLTARLGQDWEVEHLETFGVALACRDAGVPLTVLLGITNDVGPGAHAQWLANRDPVQRAVRDAARALALDPRFGGQNLSASSEPEG